MRITTEDLRLKDGDYNLYSEDEFGNLELIKKGNVYKETFKELKKENEKLKLKKERFILVAIYKDYSIKTIIDNFDKICNEIEYELNKAENDEFKAKKVVVYDRKYSDDDIKLNCYYEVGNRILYSQFIDSYFGEEDL